MILGEGITTQLARELDAMPVVAAEPGELVAELGPGVGLARVNAGASAECDCLESRRSIRERRGDAHRATRHFQIRCPIVARSTEPERSLAQDAEAEVVAMPALESTAPIRSVAAVRRQLRGKRRRRSL